MMDSNDEGITETEKNILTVIYISAGPLSAAEICRRAPQNLNLTTKIVKSCLYSLEKKRVVRNASSVEKPLWSAGERFLEYYNSNRDMDSSENSDDNLIGDLSFMNLQGKSFISLCDKVIRMLSEIDTSKKLDKLKSLFSEEIDSRRTFSEILTVENLLTVLEERGCFTESDVTPLFAIANELKMTSLFDLALKYEGRYGLLFCAVCKKEKPRLLMKSLKDAEVEGAVIFLSSDLGGSWESLCHSLGLQDDDINSYKSQHGCSLREKAYQALMKWKENVYGASVEDLITALTSDQCDRPDLANILRKGNFCQRHEVILRPLFE